MTTLIEICKSEWKIPLNENQSLVISEEPKDQKTLENTKRTKTDFAVLNI